MKPLLRDEPSLLVGTIITIGLMVCAVLVAYSCYLDVQRAPLKKPAAVNCSSTPQCNKEEKK